MHVRIAHILLVCIVLAACGRGGAQAADGTDALLLSSDRVAVYNAGVDAYRAKRYDVARRLWRRASDLGDRDAPSNLGFLFYHGLGGPPDSAVGRLFWREAMANGQDEAHRHVAQAILDGDTTLGTLADAYSHAVAARRLADGPEALKRSGVGRDAAELLAQLRGRLAPAEREAADRRGEEWARAYPASP